MTVQGRPTRIFISFSHDSPEHDRRVLELANQLRRQGLDAWIDLFEPHPAQGWLRWMQGQIERADFILLVCTETYRRRFEGKETPGTGRGVSWEGQLLGQLVYDGGGQNPRIVPVLLDGHGEDGIPLAFQGYTHYRLPDGYERLYRRLTDQPAVQPVPLGAVQVLPAEPLSAMAAVSGGIHERPDPDDESTRVLLDRIERAEFDWSGPIDDVCRKVEHKRAVVVLAPRRAGSGSFARQLCEHLQAERPDWTVVSLSVRPLSDEGVDAYLQRMRTQLGLDQPGGQLVACLHGWSWAASGRGDDAMSGHVTALGNELRAGLEGDGRTRPFYLVAVGDYPLFLLRYLGVLSLLNSADEVALPDLSVGQVFGVMQGIAPGRWSQDDASEATQRSGGHGHLVKALLRAHSLDPASGWPGAESALEDERDYVLPTLAAAANDARTRKFLERCLGTRDGVRYTFADLRAPEHYLLYSGLMKTKRRRLVFRCDTLRRLVAELFEVDSEESEV